MAAICDGVRATGPHQQPNLEDEGTAEKIGVDGGCRVTFLLARVM
jgi:hypothetical protein